MVYEDWHGVEENIRRDSGGKAEGKETENVPKRKLDFRRTREK